MRVVLVDFLACTAEGDVHETGVLVVDRKDSFLARSCSFPHRSALPGVTARPMSSPALVAARLSQPRARHGRLELGAARAAADPDHARRPVRVPDGIRQEAAVVRVSLGLDRLPPRPTRSMTGRAVAAATLEHDEASIAPIDACPERLLPLAVGHPEGKSSEADAHRVWLG